jgi:hypothetical protein
MSALRSANNSRNERSVGGVVLRCQWQNIRIERGGRARAQRFRLLEQLHV